MASWCHPRDPSVDHTCYDAATSRSHAVSSLGLRISGHQSALYVIWRRCSAEQRLSFPRRVKPVVVRRGVLYYGPCRCCPRPRRVDPSGGRSDTTRLARSFAAAHPVAPPHTHAQWDRPESRSVTPAGSSTASSTVRRLYRSALGRLVLTDDQIAPSTPFYFTRCAFSFLRYFSGRDHLAGQAGRRV